MKSKVDLTKGDFVIHINGEEFVLNSRFANQDFFEQYSNMGIYASTQRIMDGDIRKGDVARIIYCFCDKRDLEEGFSYHEIGEKIGSADLDEIISVCQKFWQVVHRIKEMETMTMEMANAKPNRKARKAADSKKKKAVKKETKKKKGGATGT